MKVSRLHPSGPQFFLHMALDRTPVSILPMALLCPLDEVKILKQGLSQPPASTLAITRLQGLFPVLFPVLGTVSLSSPHTVSLGKWKRLPHPVHLRNQAAFSKSSSSGFPRATSVRPTLQAVGL